MVHYSDKVEPHDPQPKKLCREIPIAAKAITDFMDYGALSFGGVAFSS